ncbi:6-hydroxymethylpterin diphosphokinase MptE-like protein [Sporosarcina sp. FSL W7-1349]|uniref:motility associated factor glycosyltransferase family protein n=1 Tax=Sporosarcina sp. FSL W7-1349 TaxID=2921561 RepID=UPI0030F67F38
MSSTYEIESVQTKTNLKTLKVNGFFLHSRYDPIKEAEQFAEKNYKENHLHILFGYGLGYFVKALQNKLGDNDNLLIIDPMFNELKDMVEMSNVDIVNKIEGRTIEIKINKILLASNINATIICSPNYEKLFPVEYKTVLNLVKEVLKINRLQRNTINFFAEAWQENYIRNLIHVAKDASLSELESKLDFPVVVASGGPSLIKQIPKLKEVRNRIILIASGSTVNTLLHYKIEPDFVISIDGGENNYNHYKDTTFSNSKLIYSIRNHYKIRNQFCETGFAFIPSIEPDVAKHIKQITGKELPMLLGGTSVAVYALTVALYISSGKVALIGQDLAYTDNKTHAEHNKNFRKVDENYKKKRGTFFTEGYYGEDVLTDTPFLSMKKGFEQVAEISKEHDRLYNCTEGGAKINGFQQIPFDMFCSFIQPEKVDIVLESTIEKTDFTLFKDKVQGEVQMYDQLANHLEKGINLLTSNKSNRIFDTKVVKGLNNVDKQLKKVFNQVSMNSIVNPITLDTLNNFLSKQTESKLEEFERVYKQNYELYSRLLEATKLSKQYTIDLLNEVDNKLKGEYDDGNGRTY